MEVFKHATSGVHLRLLKTRISGINTFLQVDSDNVPIIKKRTWSIHPEEQIFLINGFKNLNPC